MKTEIRSLTREDLDEILTRVARMPDGRIRVLASKLIPGKPKGPFPKSDCAATTRMIGYLTSHRRELRGLRVIASWINHWDMKEDNGLDTYVEENGRKFLRHYLIDFGSTLGAGKDPAEYFHGRAYLIDTKSILKELFTLGLYESPYEKEGTVISPAVGMFTSDDVHPEGWVSTYPVLPFDNMRIRRVLGYANCIVIYRARASRRCRDGVVQRSEGYGLCPENSSWKKIHFGPPLAAEGGCAFRFLRSTAGWRDRSRLPRRHDRFKDARS